MTSREQASSSLSYSLSGTAAHKLALAQQQLEHPSRPCRGLPRAGHVPLAGPGERTLAHAPGPGRRRPRASAPQRHVEAPHHDHGHAGGRSLQAPAASALARGRGKATSKPEQNKGQSEKPGASITRSLPLRLLPLAANPPLASTVTTENLGSCQCLPA